MVKKITDNVSWVGKIDWQLAHFHGDELSTFKGSSYNSYLIQDENTVLIDTVWRPYDHEFVSRLKEVIDLKKIDYIVMNHNEIDHSGALPELLRHIPDVPIYCTRKGEAILRGHYHCDWNYVNVKTGDTLNIGKHTLTFIEAPFMHWPDTMMTYMDGENILFSNDVFGQHFATESLYDDTEDFDSLKSEAEKYYANIITPYSSMASRKLAELLAMNLPIRLIAPSHGVIWRSHITDIIKAYQKWSSDPRDNQITIVFDTMWNSTRTMAESIAAGIQQADPEVKVRLYNAAVQDKNDILTQIFHSKAVLVGSPTINNGVTFAIAGLLEMLKGLKLKGRKGAAFGSYGWNGNGNKVISGMLRDGGIETVNDGLSMLWIPDEIAVEQCRAYGRDFVKSLAEA